MDVDRLAGEEVVAAAVIGVQVRVDDDVDTGEVEVLLAQRPEEGIHVGQQRVQLRHAGVDQDAPIGMVDDVHVDRHQLALDVQVGNVDRRDGDRARHVSHDDLLYRLLADSQRRPIAIIGGIVDPIWTI